MHFCFTYRYHVFILKTRVFGLSLPFMLAQPSLIYSYLPSQISLLDYILGYEDHKFALVIIIVLMPLCKKLPNHSLGVAQHSAVVCGCTGQLPGVNVFNCINVRLGATEKEHARSAKIFPGYIEVKKKLLSCFYPGFPPSLLFFS